MEDMDIDPVVDIPDTPDRSAGRHTNTGNRAGKEIKFSVPGYSRNPRFIEEEHFSQPRARGWPGDESGYNRRLPTHSRKNSSNVDEIDSRFNSIPSLPLDNSFASRNASLFRRTAVDKNSKHGSRDTSEAAEVGRGKVKYSKFASKSSTSRDDNDNKNSNDQNEHARMLETAFPHGRSKETLNKEVREGQIATNAGSLNSRNCSKTSNKNLSKGKEKVEDNTSRCADSIMDLGKGLNLSGDSQFNHGKQISEYHHSAVSPRVSGHKRLVRNGCISPHNISVRAKQLAERSQNGSNGVEQNHANNVVPSAPCTVDINEIVSENGNQKRPQGIRVHSCSSKDRDPEIVHLSASSTINDQGNGNSHASRDASGCLKVLGGWRSTQNRSRRGDHTSSDEHSNHFRSSDDGSFVLGQCGHGDNQSGTSFWSRHPNVAQTASRRVFNVDQTSQSRVAANALTKRQRHREATSRNNGESSRTVPDDSDIVFLGSSVESSRLRSSRIQSNQFPGVVDVDELSSETRHSNNQADDLDARARQLEADEMMARELQEQLYSESPVFGSGGVDEGIEWLVQQEEDELRNQLRHGHPRMSTRSSRQPHPRPMQNPSNRRAQVRFRTSAGTSQSRSRLPYRTRAAPSRTRNIPFPLNMDIEMRLDILEMLEAVAGDVNDVGPTGNIFQLQRDFNENDYEMLLALDENNHLHGASASQINNLPLSTVQSDNYDEVCASASQINNLPLSTVQSDNYDEVCAICLETPTVGESIRHLPCLHKFHKDCIDPWLNRKSSCPVCKSSVS